jgi:hypothetical protein
MQVLIEETELKEWAGIPEGIEEECSGQSDH